MNDINIIRKETDKARIGIKNRGGRYLPALEDIIRRDLEHRELLKKVEESRAKRNASPRPWARRRPRRTRRRPLDSWLRSPN